MCIEACMCDDIALHSFYCFQSEHFLTVSLIEWISDAHFPVSQSIAVQHKVGCDDLSACSCGWFDLSPLCMQAYVDVFTRSMQAELAASGVTYQNMAPLFVATKMSKIRKPSIAAPSPAQWARSAVKHIGYETISCPYWFHAVEWYCIAVAPAWLMNMYVLNMHLGMRKRYYKKKNAKAQ